MISPVIVVSVFFLNLCSLLIGFNIEEKKNMHIQRKLKSLRIIFGIFLLTLIYLIGVGVYGLNFYEPENKDFASSGRTAGYLFVMFLYNYYPHFLVGWSIFLGAAFFRTGAHRYFNPKEDKKPQ
jgi:hypothetical protein